MLLRDMRSRLSAVPILALRFANPLTQRGTTLVARARARACRGGARGGFRWPATRIGQVATLSPARRAISDNARGRPNRFCLCAFALGRTFSKIVDFALAAG